MNKISDHFQNFHGNALINLFSINMNGKCYQDLLNVVYASCYPAPTDEDEKPALDGASDGTGKLFYVLIIIIIILYNAYTHSVHSALHVHHHAVGREATKTASIT